MAKELILTTGEKIGNRSQDESLPVKNIKNEGTMSSNNSSTTPLGIDGVFTGVADDIKDYAAINISIFADQASATDGFSIEWSQDGTNWDEKMTVGIGKEKVESYEFGVRARYFRLVYTNGAIAQTAFRLQVIYHPVRTREGARCLCVDIDSREFAKTVRAVLAAKKPDGTYTNIHATAGGNLKLSLEEYDPTFDTNPLPVKDDKLQQYKLSDIDDGATTYLGYLDKGGKWYIAKYTDTEVRYAKGDSGYDWSNRASESYNLFNNIF